LPVGIQKDLLDCAAGSDDLSPDILDRIVSARDRLDPLNDRT